MGSIREIQICFTQAVTKTQHLCLFPNRNYKHRVPDIEERPILKKLYDVVVELILNMAQKPKQTKPKLPAMLCYNSIKL